MRPIVGASTRDGSRMLTGSTNVRVQAYLFSGVMACALPAFAQETQTSSLAAVRFALESRDSKALQNALVGLPENDRAAIPAYIAYFSAHAALLDSDPAAALKRLEKVPEKLPDGRTSPLWGPASELRAEALLRSGQGAAAAKVLLSLPDSGSRLAKAIEALSTTKGDTREAERRLLVGVPESPEAKAFVQKRGREVTLAKLSEKDRLDRIRRLLDSHENETAHAESRLLVVAGAKGKVRCEIEFIEGKALRKLRKYRAALGSLATARKTCAEVQDEDTELRASLLEAQVANISRSPGQVGRIVDSMIAKAPRHGFVDDALFLLAETQEQSGQRDLALRTYRRVIDEFPAGDMAATAAWRIAFDAIKRGEPQRAHDELAKILDLGDDVARARSRYWLARTYTGTSTTFSCDAFRRAAVEPALTFYAFLAVDRLSRTNPSCASRLKNEILDGVGKIGSKPPAPDSIEKSDIRDRARRLGHGGFFAFAEAELDLLDRPNLDRDEVVALALAYSEVEAQKKAQWLLRTRAGALLRTLPDASNAWIWRTAYSRPFQTFVEDAARKAKIEPLLLQGLSREESTFDPNIVSWAGAVGLAQLMPATAIGAYADLRLGKLDLSKLTDPALNLRLGGYVLADNLREFRGSVPLALAAYNGGAGLTRKVLPSTKTEFDFWVETIPVKETRGYVGRVSGTWGVYRLLYDRENPFISLPAFVP